MRAGEWIVSILFLGPLILGFITVSTLYVYINSPGPYLLSILILYFTGFLMFLKAKISVIKKGNLLSFGTKHMSRPNQLFYIYGYLIMCTGFLLSFAVIALSFSS